MAAPTRRAPARSSSGRSSSGRSSGKGSGRGTGTRKAPARRPPVRSGPSSQSWPVRAVRGLYLGVAHGLGGLTRSITKGARDLEPEHRRDGVAFFLIALALVVAAREWWGISGTFGTVVHAVVAGTVGLAGVAVPVLLLWLGFRVMRHPERGQANSRVAIGLIFVVVSVCALVAIAEGTPAPADGFEALQDAGGIIGYLAATPVVTGLTEWVAVPLFLLLGFFGILVVTATPVHRIPERLRGLYDRLTGNHREEPVEDDGLALAEGVSRHDGTDPAPRKKRTRKTKAQRAAEAAAADGLDEYVGDEAFEKAATLEK
ncbi:DNA translocase FtsK 4TM domain-containing protein, partial [Isoptericola sp. NPDC057391]|uniref:DNA translocase FtsK 4TM domain-containing protein n=1 Tax=Isoptericola sp. NPDC057391 TaxID=3346117 RepID=UPI00362FC770